MASSSTSAPAQQNSLEKYIDLALWDLRFEKLTRMLEAAHLHFVSQNAVTTHVFPTGTNIKAVETSYLCMKVFFLIKHYKLKPEIPSSFTAEESIKEK